MKRLLQVVGVLAALIVVALALFPVFAKPNRQPGVYLLNALGEPVSGERVRVGCGSEVVECATDTRGGIYVPEGCRSTPSVEGYSLAYTTRHTGGNPGKRYYFSPAGRMVFRFVDDKGRDLPGGGRILSHFDRNQQVKGPAKEIVYTDQPFACRPWDIRVQAASPTYRLVDLEKRFEGNTLYVEVVFGRHPSPRSKPLWYVEKQDGIGSWPG